jgi:hypothetical protein
MMGRRLLLVVALAAAFLFGVARAAGADGGTTPAHVEEVSVADLLADPGAYSAVVVRGELVGDFGERGDGTVWTQLNDDAYVQAPIPGGGSSAGVNVGIGVRIPAELWPGFDRPGGYRVRGPVVELQGTWRYHDPDRGGESYLDVTGLELLEPPRALEEGVDWLPLGLGAGLLALAGVVSLLTRRRGE